MNLLSKSLLTLTLLFVGACAKSTLDGEWTTGCELSENNNGSSTENRLTFKDDTFESNQLAFKDLDCKEPVRTITAAGTFREVSETNAQGSFVIFDYGKSIKVTLHEEDEIKQLNERINQLKKNDNVKESRREAVAALKLFSEGQPNELSGPQIIELGVGSLGLVDRSREASFRREGDSLIVFSSQDQYQQGVAYIKAKKADKKK